MEALVTVRGMRERYGCSNPTARKYLRMCNPHTENPPHRPGVGCAGVGGFPDGCPGQREDGASLHAPCWTGDRPQEEMTLI